MDINDFFKRNALRGKYISYIIVFISLLVLCVFAVFIALKNESISPYITNDRIFITVFIVASSSAFIILVVEKYLSGRKIDVEDTVHLKARIKDLQNRLEVMYLAQVSKGGGTEDLAAKLKELREEQKLQMVDLAKKELESNSEGLIPKTLGLLKGNIDTYIEKLNRNSIVNLIIGILGTVISISILALSLLNNHSYESIEKFLLNFIPKLSFVIFIQLFSFFFLRLYKNNLEDSKYFQNELTNILAKSTAIQIAEHLGDTSLLTQIVLDLSKTERNFKLAAGESLLNIERTKIEKEYDIELLNTFKDFLKTQKKD